MQPNIFEAVDFSVTQTTNNVNVYTAPEEDPSKAWARGPNNENTSRHVEASTSIPDDAQNSQQPSTSTVNTRPNCEYLGL